MRAVAAFRALGPIDLRAISRDSLMGQMAVVTQEPFLFDGTIRDNVRYGRPDASDEEVRAAAEAAVAVEFLDRMPDGFDTSTMPNETGTD